MSEDQPLYNSKIISTFLKLLNKKYPQVDQRELLLYADIKPYQVNDEGHWFAQRQVDRFHEKLTELVGCDIAREGGRYAASEESLGVMGKHVFGTIGPANTFFAIGNAASNFTKSSLHTCRKIADNKVEITVTPLAGVDEKLYQCENRIGFYEAVVTIFNHQAPEVEHPECMFRGGSCCRYILSWENTPYAVVRRIRNVVLPLVLLLYAPFDYFLEVGHIGEMLVGLGFLALAASYLAERLEKMEIAKALSKLKESTDTMIEEIGVNYDNARMVNEVGQAITKQGSINEVLENVIKVVEKRLGYDRCVIMLADAKKGSLKFCTGYGYDEKQQEVLEKTSFNLTDSDSKGIFVSCFRDRKSIFVNDFAELTHIHSPKSVSFSETMGADSFICCAILCEGESLGVLAVDNMKSRKKLKQSDLSLLTGIAPLIGMTLRNAIFAEREKRITEQVRQSQKMEAVGLLARGIAHDFNNLLTAITGFVNLAQMKMSQDDPAAGFLDHVISAADRAATLTRGLLTFSRKQATNPEYTDLNTLVNSEQRLLSRLITNDIELKIEMSEEHLPVFADSGQIDQAVMNLVTNARDAMPEGGVLTVKTGMMEMGVEFLESHGYGAIGQYAVLSVTDTGTGMDDATKAHIMEPFFTTKEVGKGTGLGLAIVYGIVKQHDGYLEIDSQPEKGTTFNVYLPLLTTPPRASYPFLP
ncbi:MAG TPA: diguanylate cyclase [Geobacter sp.]|nr:diguanylate cyclase [Geobacter sp.]